MELYFRFFYQFYFCMPTIKGYKSNSQTLGLSVGVIFFLWPRKHTPSAHGACQNAEYMSKSLSYQRQFVCVALGFPAVKQELSFSLSDLYSSEWKTVGFAQGVCISARE